MIKGEVIEQVKKAKLQKPNPLFYSVEDVVKITQLVSILINIDQKEKLRTNETKGN